jgi:hypothetical protein
VRKALEVAGRTGVIGNGCAGMTAAQPLPMTPQARQ